MQGNGGDAMTTAFITDQPAVSTLAVLLWIIVIALAINDYLGDD